MYYGWVILIAGSMGILASIPGQTMGVSVFTDHYIAAFQSTRVGVSSAYMIGTLASALLIPLAGRWYDRSGARITASVSAVMLALFLLFLSSSSVVTETLSTVFSLSPGVVGFAAAAAGFFGIRFFGQGVLTLVSRAMVVQWFGSRRGLAVGILGIFTAFGFSYAPRPLQGLIDLFGWIGALQFLAAVLVCLFLPLSILVYRSTPESCGMKIEEGMKRRITRRPVIHDAEVSSTLAEAKRDLRYWVLVLLLWFWGFYNTAVTFHVISIFSEVGRNTAYALGIFFPIALISVVSKFVSSWASDRINLKWLIILHALSAAVSGLAVSLLALPAARTLLIVSMGISGGLFGMLNMISWPRLFGRKHLGAVSGFAMGWIVAGSAVGPWFFSVIFQFTGGYRFAGTAGLAAGIIIAVCAAAVPFSRKSAAASCGHEKPAASTAKI